MDIEMLVMSGGAERTEDEFSTLLASAGFTLQQVVPTGTAYNHRPNKLTPVKDIVNYIDYNLPILKLMIGNDMNLNPISKLHHAAYRCRDAEQTRWFYKDVLGLKLAAALEFDQMSGTGIDRNYLHLFFDLGDDSLEGWKNRLKAAHVKCVGPVDHGFARSLYFYDPNGIQCKIACNTDAYSDIMSAKGASAQDTLKDWTSALDSRMVDTLMPTV